MRPGEEPMIPFEYRDGGREAAGFKGKAGDCGVRAFCNATGADYLEVYDLVNELAQGERPRTRRGGVKKKSRSNARTGIHRPIMDKLVARIGGTWTPTMQIGQGCRVHVRADELPAEGRHVLNLSRHFAALVDGVLLDTYDCSREGTRCVYGFWTVPEIRGSLYFP